MHHLQSFSRFRPAGERVLRVQKMLDGWPQIRSVHFLLHGSRGSRGIPELQADVAEDAATAQLRELGEIQVHGRQLPIDAPALARDQCIGFRAAATARK